jgi:hypothetical protein
MNEFFNFHNSWILVEHNWLWLALAFALGLFVGWTTAIPSKQSK